MNIVKTSLLLLFIAFCSTASAISPVKKADSDSLKKWTFSSLNMLTINQIAFVNWASGGESSLSAKISSDYLIKYKHNKFSFKHKGKLAFGLVGYIDKRVEKTDDVIDLLYAVSHDVSDHWSLTVLLTFNSQFAKGYKYPNDTTLISAFMSPAYVMISSGFNYEPIEEFQVYLSPVAGKLTFVLNQELADKGAFGVKKAVLDSTGMIVEEGENFLAEIGIKVLTSYKKKLMKNIKLNSVLSLYNNYTDPVISNRWNIDVDFDTRVIFTINKVFSTVLYMHLKYDHNTVFQTWKTIEDKKVLVSESPKMQFKESFGLSLTYKI